MSEAEWCRVQAGAALRAMRLTVGIACRDGLPHLHACLAALPAVAACAADVEFILVDSASSDGTLEAMLAFAKNRRDTRVLSMHGHVNLAATRNVILDAARPGAVFIVDGDVAVNAAFVAAALAALDADRCDIVFGRLPEVIYDGSHRPVGRNDDRYRVDRECFRTVFHGIVLLGEAVARAGARYDTRLRRGEDTDLAVRLAERFRILALATEMGTHHTVPYYHADRLATFYRQRYTRPIGSMIRKHLWHPKRLWRGGRHVFVGGAIGLLTQALFVVALLSTSPLAIAAAAALIAVDFGQLAVRGRGHHFVPVRIVGAWFLAWGILFPEWDAPRYQLTVHDPKQ